MCNGPYELAFDDGDPLDDDDLNRAYDDAMRRHAKAQEWEDRNTGMTLDVPSTPDDESEDAP